MTDKTLVERLRPHPNLRFAHEANAAGIDVSRIADQCIQRWRRKGWIAFSRKKGTPVWSLTEDGKKALGSRA